MSLEAVELSHTSAESRLDASRLDASRWPQRQLLLSLFPGAGLLDRGFEQAGFIVVRGPDTVFGQSIETFHALPDRFNGLIGGPQERNRSFQFGSRDGVPLVILRSTQSQFKKLSPAAMAKDVQRNFAHLCELQGLPRDFDLPGLSRTAKARAIGNGVPVPMARAVAEAIRDRGVTPLPRLCICNCGRPVTGKQISATPACRKRIERSRRAAASTQEYWREEWR